MLSICNKLVNKKHQQHVFVNVSHEGCNRVRFSSFFEEIHA